MSGLGRGRGAGGGVGMREATAAAHVRFLDLGSRSAGVLKSQSVHLII